VTDPASSPKRRRLTGWDVTRQLVLFALGIAMLVYELVTPDARASLELVGLVLVGLVPVDAALTVWTRRGR
jgi:hypothetical protein